MHIGWDLAYVLSLYFQVLNSALKIHMELIHMYLLQISKTKGTEK